MKIMVRVSKYIYIYIYIYIYDSRYKKIQEIAYNFYSILGTRKLSKMPTNNTEDEFTKEAPLHDMPSKQVQITYDIGVYVAIIEIT